VWDALGLEGLSVLRERPGWPAHGASGWADAVARGKKVPKNYRIPDPLVGQPFAGLPDPWVPARELGALPFHLFGVRDGKASIDAMV
jgi:hypothetical protein